MLDDEGAATDVDEPVDGRRSPASTFDLGHIAAGTLPLEVSGAAPGTVVDIAAAEHLDAAGRLAPLGQHAGLRYVCGGRRRRAIRVLRRHRHPASPRRLFARRSTASEPELRSPVHDRHRPRPEGASFECSDPLLEQIYEVGLRTVDLCALDAYVDCPTREQRAWTGDSVVHQMVDLVTNPDWSMARWHPQLAAAPRADGMLAMAVASDFAADDRTFVPDWSLHWVRSVHNLYRYTGDRELIAELLPVAERTLRWFESYLADDGSPRPSVGLVAARLGERLLDGPLLDPERLCGPARSEDLAEMAAWLGNEGTAAWARARYRGR